MAVKKIRILNFKSFKNLEVELGNFNVLIGANASGKSNFVQVFKFLRDVVTLGLDNAVSLQGGVGYLRNINIGSSENFSLEVVSDLKYSVPVVTSKERRWTGININETIYKFAMKFRKKGLGFEIAEDRLTQKGEFVRFKIHKNVLVEEKEKLGPGEIIFSNVNGKIKVDSNLPDGTPIKEDDVLPFFMEKRLPPKTSLIQAPAPFFMPHLFRDISIYDFDPKLPKKATPITGKAELEDDGSNLAIVLKNIIKNKDKERKLSNLVRNLLPFVNKLNIEKFADKSLLFKLQEIYSLNQYLPAFLISDGTINIAALTIALYFEEKSLTIIEEPERNIHPYLISKVINMMKDASQKKQIIATTHNPEIVKHASLEDILLISRDKEGFSAISRPSEKEEVKTFLKNEIGIEELYVQNLLEA